MRRARLYVAHGSRSALLGPSPLPFLPLPRGPMCRVCARAWIYFQNPVNSMTMKASPAAHTGDDAKTAREENSIGIGY